MLSLQGLRMLRLHRELCSSLVPWTLYCWRPQLLLMMTMMMMTVWKDWTTLKTYWCAAGFLRPTHQQLASQSILDREALLL